MRLGHSKILLNTKKPELQEAPIDKQIKIDLEKLLEANKDSFAEDETNWHNFSPQNDNIYC